MQIECKIILHFIRVYTVEKDKNNLQTKCIFCFENYNLIPLDIYNGLSHLDERFNKYTKRWLLFNRFIIVPHFLDKHENNNNNKNNNNKVYIFICLNNQLNKSILGNHQSDQQFGTGVGLIFCNL